VDIGAQLRSSREARRLSLEALARMTRVQPRILAAIEHNDATAIPPRPFGRGFVRAYAKEVGLDPDQTVRDYFEQFAVAPPEAYQAPEVTVSPVREVAPRAPWPVAAILTVVVLVVTGVLLFRQSTRTIPDNGVVGTSGATAPRSESPSAEPVRQPVDRGNAPAQPPAPAPSHPIDIVISATAPCWVTASADGRRVIYQLLRAGDRFPLQAASNVSILAGDAGALTWTINGRNVGTFGGAGVIRTVTVTPANVASIR
jgi:cytoskeleton protein RodZ